jgi:hypothetical protein
MRKILWTLAVAAPLGAAGPGTAEEAGLALAPTNGPWMICVKSDTGPQAGPLAHELAQEIRARHRLAAYVFNRGKDEADKQQKGIDERKKLYPGARVKRVRIEEQYAVLIGDYRDMDAARRALDAVKKLPTPSDKLCDFVSVATPLEGEKAEVKGTFYNPFPGSFVVRNPLAPQERRPENLADPALKSLNSGEEYSLLKCKKPWTLAIAVFQGATYYQGQNADPSLIERFFGDRGGERLSASAQNAHDLVEVLRRKLQPEFRVEAYVLHTRNCSIVTVGGFDGPDDKRVQETATFLAKHLLLPGVQLLPQPVPMPVPRP